MEVVPTDENVARIYGNINTQPVRDRFLVASSPIHELSSVPGVPFLWARDSGGFGVRISVFSVLLATALFTRPLFGELAYDDFLIDTGDAAGVLLHGNLTSGEVDDLIVFTNGGEDLQRQFTVYAFDGLNWRHRPCSRHRRRRDLRRHAQDRRRRPSC